MNKDVHKRMNIRKNYNNEYDIMIQWMNKYINVQWRNYNDDRMNKDVHRRTIIQKYLNNEYNEMMKWMD